MQHIPACNETHTHIIFLLLHNYSPLLCINWGLSGAIFTFSHHFEALSYALEMARSLFSSHALPINCRPMGSLQFETVLIEFDISNHAEKKKMAISIELTSVVMMSTVVVVSITSLIVDPIYIYIYVRTC